MPAAKHVVLYVLRILFRGVGRDLAEIVLAEAIPAIGWRARRVGDGRLWTIEGIERDRMLRPLRPGDRVGLLFDSPGVKVGDELELIPSPAVLARKGACPPLSA